MTLKTYFNLIVAVIMVLLFAAITSFSLINSKAFVKQQLAQQTQLVGQNAVQTLKVQMGLEQDEMIKRFADFKKAYEFTYLRLQHNNTTLLEHRSSPKTVMPAWLQSLLALNSPLFQQSVYVDEREYLVQLQISNVMANDYIFQQLKDVCLIFAFFTFLTWFVFRVAINIIKAPIEALQQHTNKLADNDFSVAPEIHSVSEMNALMSSHNRMTNQVKELVNELTKRLEHAKNALYRDELTQLGNRRLFSAQFSQLLHEEKNQNGALILMRLSEWENVRRKEGFLVARSFLEDVIHTLQSNSKQGANARIFRLNDNEFACVLQHLTRDELVKLLNDLSSDLARLQGRYQQKKEVLIGAVLWHSNDDMSAVMKAADEAVLMATKERWQYHLYEPSERIKKVSDMLATREGVLLAINESSLHLSQHGVMMSDQLNLMFSEVLSKIQYKDEIIPTLLLQSKAEQFSASAQLDKRIFDQIRALYIKGNLDLPVSINVSVHSVLDDEFYAWLMEQSHQYGDLFSSIIWEFDEMMLSQSQLAPQVITKLHKLGSKVAIDHFGTGDNTLLALRKWPVDIVKLDGSFIHELEQKQDSWYFLENIIKLAHSLGVVVVCEQLESEQQVKWAKELGSDGLQGFKLALPHSVS
ncbi:EAL domain-containing protein [Pseudoalteromonas sp. SSM20]|uniref:EAL domain-containing protein n=1 Tax=Pseudoalteromonas sp. SSM20 TaxID=3139394 RepID=UPI003BA8FD18